MLLFGYHRGHDLEIHLQSWMETSAQFRHKADNLLWLV